MRALFSIAVLAIGATTQLSCSVNDYCLHCEIGDGGDGDGGSGSDDGGGSNMDAMEDAGCVPSNAGVEACDGLDNDCNGLVDDGVLPMVGQLCTEQDGECAGGVNQCVNGKLECTKKPSPEICDSKDNNCNGTEDEGDPGGGGKCGTDMGECVAGQFHCNAATGTVECYGFIDHTQDPELCDGKDNDCDGTMDDGLTNMGACGPTTNEGECQISHLECQAGTPICVQPVKFPEFEKCDLKDNDCDAKVDEVFNKAIDPLNCVTCGTICMPTSKTCINTNNNTNGATCTMDAQCPGGSCATNSQPRCNNGCTFQCNAGFKDLDTSAANGCEYRCFATGAEECDGADNDCDGKTDEGVTPPAICISGGECGTTAPTATCGGPSGWTCTYPGTVQFPETLCDGLNNDCDANVDEKQAQQLGDACSEVPETVCTGAVDNDNDGFVNDGCPVVGTAETNCGDAVDNDADGAINDGCAAKEERGVCKSSGSYTCNPNDLNGDAICTITTQGATPDANETCDDRDNDCDGQTDEGGANGTLIGQEWVDVGGGRQMMKYEASKPDATTTAQGTRSNRFACSRAGVQPWTNITYPQALAQCQKIGATLCTEVQWHRACSVITPTTYPLTISASTFIEAEDYLATAYAGAKETACTGTTDDDGDGLVNDGCPIVGAAAEGSCTGVADDDTDGTVNDGCPAIGPHSWVEDYTAGFSGIAAVEATPNLGGTFAAGALTGAPTLDYTVNFTTTSSTYHVWVKMYANSTSNDRVFVGLVGGATPTAATATTLGSWHWVDAGVIGTNVSGQQTIRIWMGDDGTKIDKIYIINGSTTAGTISGAETINSKGGKWAYATSPNNYSASTCNGDDLDTNNAVNGDQDDTLATGALTSCKAAIGTGVFDMSGNVKEWTLAHAPGENPIRGGASNNTGEGISCPLNFTLANDTFLFPNIGFRCCK